MAKRRSPAQFERPRDEEGHYLPMELWTKKEVREFEKWQKKKKKQPRDAKGRFVSPTGKRSKKKTSKSAITPVVDYPVVVHPQDGTSVHQGNVTVVYPPYPPPPAPPVQAPVASPQIQYVPFPMQIPQQDVLQVEEDRENGFDEDEDELRNHQLDLFDEDHGIVYEQDPSTGEMRACGNFMDLRGGQRRIDQKQKWVIKQLKRLIDGQKLTQRELRAVRDACGFEEIEDIAVDQSFSGPVENPRDRYPMYYVKRTFSEKVGDALGFVRENPIVALVAVGTLFVVGYAIYRAFKAYRCRLMASSGVDIVNNVIYFPGEQPYQITDADKLWLARSIWGEVNRNPSAWSRPDVKQGAAAVMWSYANHYMTVGEKRNLYPSLGDFVQAYSQPINPRWDEASDARCQSSPEMCTPDRLAFRQGLRTTPWTQFPAELQNLVLAFASGQVPNPIGTRTDFRAAGTGYTPADPVNVAGNIFGTAPNARRRPTEQVA